MWADNSALTHQIMAVPIHDPAAPHPYAPWVLVVGIVLLLLVGGWLAWVFWYTRKRPAPDPVSADNYQTLRGECIAMVDDAQERYRTGEADLRALHLDLNHIIRDFISRRFDVDVSSLTAEEIGRLDDVGRLGDLLAEYVEPSFAHESDARALAATTKAREVMAQW